MGCLIVLLILPFLANMIQGEIVGCGDVDGCTGDMECSLGGSATGCQIDCLGGGVIECVGKA